MKGTIRRLFGAAALLVALSATSWYVGSQVAANATPTQQQNALSQQFTADPGDGWMILGIFLLVLAIAISCAGAMLWSREERS